MPKEQTFTAVLVSAARRTNSPSGNPTWSIRTDSGRYRTGMDAAIGYDVENHAACRRDSPDYWVGKRVEFTASMAGRITGWRLADDQGEVDRSDIDGPDARENDQ